MYNPWEKNREHSKILLAFLLISGIAYYFYLSNTYKDTRTAINSANSQFNQNKSTLAFAGGRETLVLISEYEKANEDLAILYHSQIAKHKTLFFHPSPSTAIDNIVDIKTENSTSVIPEIQHDTLLKPINTGSMTSPTTWLLSLRDALNQYIRKNLVSMKSVRVNQKVFDFGQVFGHESFDTRPELVNQYARQLVVLYNFLQALESMPYEEEGIDDASMIYEIQDIQIFNSRVENTGNREQVGVSLPFVRRYPFTVNMLVTRKGIEWILERFSKPGSFYEVVGFDLRSTPSARRFIPKNKTIIKDSPIGGNEIIEENFLIYYYSVELKLNSLEFLEKFEAD